MKKPFFYKHFADYCKTKHYAKTIANANTITTQHYHEVFQFRGLPNQAQWSGSEYRKRYLDPR